MKRIRGIAVSLALILSTFWAGSSAGDGEPDTTFGAGGGVLVDLSRPGSEADSALGAVLVQPDGKIVVAGSYQFTNGSPDWDFAVKRLNPDGSTDVAFADDGLFRIAIDLVAGGRDQVVDAALLGDGKIVLAGMADAGVGVNRRTALFQLLSDGTPDGTFGVSGLSTFGSNSYQDYLFAVDGSSRGDVLSTAAYSFDQPGAHDTALLPGATTTTFWYPPNSDDAFMYGLAEARGTRRLFAGEVSGTTSNLAVLAISVTTQAPDLTFGDEGWATIRATSPGGDWNSLARAVAHYPGDRFIAGGTARRDFDDAFVARLLADGSLDPTFAGDGQQYMRWQVPGTIQSDIYDIEVQADHRILFGGVTSDGVEGSPVIARLDSNGAYDLEFMGTGWGTLPDPPGYELLGQPSVTIQRDGNIIVAAVARALDPEGLDKVYVGRLLSPSTFMFRDDFESGDTTAWD